LLLDSGVAQVDDPGIAQLPAVIALPMLEYLRESDPVLRLYRLCDATEIIVRFLAIIALGELQRQQAGTDLPHRVLREIQPHIERPTFGEWLRMLDTLTRALPEDRLLVVPEFRKVVQPLLERTRGGARAHPKDSLLSLRDLLHHGGGMTRTAARDFLATWAPWWEALVGGLAFLREVNVCVVADNGGTRRLVGASVEAQSFDPPVSVREPARSAELAGHVVLFKDRTASLDSHEFLDLWPLHIYGRASRQTTTGISQAAVEGPLVYLRYERNRLLYAALGVDIPTGERRDVVDAFRGLFRLTTPEPREKNRVYDFEGETRADAAALIGREPEVRHAKDVLKDKTTGVFWIGGPGGIGKSFLLAKLAADLGNDPKRVCRIAWRFKASDGARCNRWAFLRHAVERLSDLSSRTDASATQDPSALLDRLVELLAELSLPSGKPSPPHVMFVLDGMDEIARIDPDFLEIPSRLAAYNTVWVCAGRPEGAIPEIFAPERCTHIFPNGLPPMDAADIRSMLLETTGSLKYGLLSLDEERNVPDRTAAVINNAVNAVATRAQGLPLYVHFVIEDILAGNFRFEDLEERLPPGLAGYYGDLLQRYGMGDLRTVLTPLVVLLAWAPAPVDQETLYLFMVRHGRVRADGHGRELIQRALEAVQSMVRTRATDTQQGGFELYHETFREHIRRDDGANFQNENELAQKFFRELVRDWDDLLEEPLRDYVFRHGLRFLIDSIARETVNSAEASSALEVLTDLVRSKFLPSAAARVGIVETLVSARAAAEMLADHGADRWDDLVAAAYQYSSLVEELNANPQVLARFLDQGDAERAYDLTETEPEPSRRGLMKLALSRLITSADDSELASKLWEEGCSLVRHEEGDDQRILPGEDKFVRVLARGLLLTASTTDEPAFYLVALTDIGAKFGEANRWTLQDPNLVEPRRTFPWWYLALAWFSSKSLARNVGLFFLGLVSWLFLANGLFGPIDFEPVWPFLLVAVQIGFWFAILRWPAKWLLSARRQQINRWMISLVRGMHEAPEHEARRVWKSIERFQSLLNLPDDKQTWTLTLSYMFKGLFQHDLEPPEAAGIIAASTGLGETVCNRLILELRQCPPAQLDAFYRAISGEWEKVKDPYQLLRIMVATAGFTQSPEVALDVVDACRQHVDEEDERWDDLPWLLKDVPGECIAKTLLAALPRDRHTTNRRADLWTRLTRFLQHYGFIERAPMRRSLMLGVALLLAPAILFVIMIGIPAIATIVIPVLFFITLLVSLAGRIRDPYCLTNIQPNGVFATYLHRLTERLAEAGFWPPGREKFPAEFMVEGPRVARTLIAESLVGNDQGHVIDMAARQVPRALKGLVRSGALGRSPTLILQLMGDRRLLDAVTRIQTVLPPAKGARRIDESESRQQLRRVLPLRSPWVNLGLVTAIVGLVVFGWYAAESFTGPRYPDAELWRRTTLEILALSVFFACTQHAYAFVRSSFLWKRIRASSHEYSRALPYRTAVVLGSLGSALLWPRFLIALPVALLITNLLAPEVVARWRGAPCLYPTARMLHAQRLAACALLVASIVLLTLVGTPLIDFAARTTGLR